MKVIALVAATLFGMFVVANALIAGVSLSFQSAVFLVCAPSIVFWLVRSQWNE